MNKPEQEDTFCKVTLRVIGGAIIGGIGAPLWLYMGTYGSYVGGYKLWAVTCCAVGGAFFGLTNSFPTFDLNEKLFESSNTHRKELHRLSEQFNKQYMDRQLRLANGSRY